MKNFSTLWGRVLVTAVLALAGASTFAQEAAIRKNLGSRLPEFQKIDEVTKTEMPGIFEVRVDNDLFYTDASGSYLIQGHMIDVNQRRNVTAERMEKITAIAFDETIDTQPTNAATPTTSAQKPTSKKAVNTIQIAITNWIHRPARNIFSAPARRTKRLLIMVMTNRNTMFNAK